MKIKIEKYVKSILVVLLIASIAICYIISQDIFHINNCEEKHCPVCHIIHMAQTFIRNIVIVHFIGSNAILIYYTLTKIYKYIFCKTHIILVNLNIQLNE